MINRTTFFEKIRGSLFKGSLSQLQVQSIESIIDEAEKQGITDNRQVAYLLATPYHECYNPRHPETRLTPITEFGSETYLKSKPYYPYIARGFSGLTWKVNYQKESLRTGIDLVNNPDAILSLPLASNSHVHCMLYGVYTGKKLSDYINPTLCNFTSARKIINGLDNAALIAGYARRFLECMQ